MVEAIVILISGSDISLSIVMVAVRCLMVVVRM